jgi:hypothetical protein
MLRRGEVVEPRLEHAMPVRSGAHRTARVISSGPAPTIMLWAITSYFNPAGYRTRLENYRRFRAHLTVPLVTVEASFDGRFELGPADADILVQRHAATCCGRRSACSMSPWAFCPPSAIGSPGWIATWSSPPTIGRSGPAPP